MIVFFYRYALLQATIICKHSHLEPEEKIKRLEEINNIAKVFKKGMLTAEEAVMMVNRVTV